MSTKTLRVTLADIHAATGAGESSATVLARYVDTRQRGRDIHLTDGTIVVPVRRTSGATGSPQHFDFTVYPSDDPAVREVDRGFLVEVSWKVTAPEGGTSSGVRRVLITDDMDPVVSLGLLATPTPIPPYSGGYVTPEGFAGHLADTTDVHGIPNTSLLVTTTDPRLSDSRVPLTHSHTLAETTDSATRLAMSPAERNKINSLGTAASSDATNYATAAQGVKADTAVQPPALTAYAPTARTVAAGTGLTGGGDLAADRSLAADFGTGAGKVVQGNDSRFGQIAGVTVSGTAAANQVPVASSSTAAAWGGVPFELRGTGSPEGVVTAAVGTYYTDTNGTNGAWRWLKKAGAAATGWAVVTGDTGWRNVSALLKNGWTGTLYVRRMNETVDVRFEGLNAASATSGTPVTLPAGFLAGTTVATRALLHTTAVVIRRITQAGGTGDVVVTAYVAGDVLYGTLTGTTVDAWPTTLP